jgi:NADPH2:quinone reductase
VQRVSSALKMGSIMTSPLMKAVVLNNATMGEGPDWELFQDQVISKPELKPRDIRVEVKAAGVNPIDLKMTRSKKSNGMVLGWDVAGVVESVGSDVTLFKAGYEVYYAGSVIRPGGFSELQVVDERIVGSKPVSLSFAQAASLPLTGITVWEALFEKMGIPFSAKSEKTLLVLAGAGGIGSIAIQLGAKVGGLKVIASASREDSKVHCMKMGASAVINHKLDISQQVTELGDVSIDYVICATDPAPLLQQLEKILSPLGKICCLVESSADLPMNILRNKGIAFIWEGAFTRSLFKTNDLIKQHEILNEISRLIDDGVLQHTLSRDLGQICAQNLSRACEIIDSGNSVGKIVMTGFN